jgi:hypothetical protein
MPDFREILTSAEIAKLGSSHWGTNSTNEWLRLIAYQLTFYNEHADGVPGEDVDDEEDGY